jgi:hypothetical protein
MFEEIIDENIQRTLPKRESGLNPGSKKYFYK